MQYIQYTNEDGWHCLSMAADGREIARIVRDLIRRGLKWRRG